MSNPFRSPEDYELFLYTLQDQFPSIQHSTVVFIRRGASLARVAGEIYFDNDIRIVVRERVVHTRLPVTIDWYGYEVWQGEEKLFWYDPQPHPNEPALQGTHPHHKHIPPDMKQNRIPAPVMSFNQPNLPVLIDEVEKYIEKQKKSESEQRDNQ